MNNLEKLNVIESEIFNFSNKINELESQKRDLIYLIFKDLSSGIKWNVKLKPYCTKLVPQDISIFYKLEKYIKPLYDNEYQIDFVGLEGYNLEREELVLRWSLVNNEGYLEINKFDFFKKFICDFKLKIIFDTSVLEKQILDFKNNIIENEEIIKFAREYKHE